MIFKFPAQLSRLIKDSGASPDPSGMTTDAHGSWVNFLRRDITPQRKELVLSTLDLIEATGAAAYVDAIGSSLQFGGKKLLEVGCHYCWYAPYFLKKGCLSYHGIDLELDRGHRQISGPHGEAEAPIAFSDFVDSFASLSISDCDIRDLSASQDGFDAAFMISTSEHFDDPRGCFAALAALLSPGSRVFINHHNYYSWNGHHRAPWRVQDVDPSDARHLAVVDWGHVRNRVRNHDSPNFLNYIRMHELIAVVSEYFDIESKKMIRFGPDTGEGRLSETILDELSHYYREELETVSLHLFARKRTDGLRLSRPQDHSGEHRYAIEIGWCQREIGNAFITRVPSIGNLTGLTLVEDNTPLGPAGALHDAIRNTGAGAYSLWGNYLYFSTSDNTDPAVNGRKYVLKSG